MPSLTIKNIPEDVIKHILKIQGEKKAEKGIGQYSQQQAIFQIIREHKESVYTQIKNNEKD